MDRPALKRLAAITAGLLHARRLEGRPASSKADLHEPNMRLAAAYKVLRYNPCARKLYTRLCRGQQNRKKKAIVAVAGKLLVRCWAMLRDGRLWQALAITATER